MEQIIETLKRYMGAINEQIAQHSNAYYCEKGLNKILELEEKRIENFGAYLIDLDKKGRLGVYASTITHKHIPDIADRIPMELVV